MCWNSWARTMKTIDWSMLLALTWNTCTSTIWWTQPWTFYWRWCRSPDWSWRTRIRATGIRWPRVPAPSTRDTRRKICSVEKTGPSRARTWRKPSPTPCWLSAPLQRRSRPTISSSFCRGETWEHGGYDSLCLPSGFESRANRPPFACANGFPCSGVNPIERTRLVLRALTHNPVCRGISGYEQPLNFAIKLCQPSESRQTSRITRGLRYRAASNS